MLTSKYIIIILLAKVVLFSVGIRYCMVRQCLVFDLGVYLKRYIVLLGNPKDHLAELALVLARGLVLCSHHLLILSQQQVAVLRFRRI